MLSKVTSQRAQYNLSRVGYCEAFLCSQLSLPYYFDAILVDNTFHSMQVFAKPSALFLFTKSLIGSLQCS